MVSLIRNGDAEAFDEVYDRYWLKLYAEAARRVRSEDDAKDVVQDLFITLWEKRESIEIRNSLAAYLFTAIRNRILNYIKANIVKGDYLDTLAATIHRFDHPADAQAISDDMDSFIDQWINHLSPRVKQIFMLSRRENLSIREIAQKLSLSDQTVKNQLGKAVSDLRRYVGRGAAGLSSLLGIFLGS